MEKHIFIIGSKGIPARYGGFETFVEKLVEHSTSGNIHYYISCLGDKGKSENYYSNAELLYVKAPSIGGATAVLYDILSLLKCIKYIKEKKIEKPIIYILAARIGPFLNLLRKHLTKFNIKIFLNPDGHEWKRSKWNWFIKKYWKISERYMVKNSDLVICDSIGIEDYIQHEYSKYHRSTMFIPYGAEIKLNSRKNDNGSKWLQKNQLNIGKYYLVVGRFVPENNLEIIIKEFIKSKTEKDLVIITNNPSKSKFYSYLLKNTKFNLDRRIKFVGTVYDEDLLLFIRKNAFAYIHGHEVGGTNPSLLEALAITNLNLLLNVIFNKEVAESAALYFDKDEGSLESLINYVEDMDNKLIDDFGNQAKKRISEKYTWDKVVNEYELIFMGE